MPTTSSRARRSRFAVVVGLLVVLIAGAASAPAAADPTPTSARPEAKAKCVKTANGFARYSLSGACRKGERRDTKPCANGGSCVVGDVGPGGGTVFYSARTVQPWGRYLEAASDSWNGPADDPNVAWCQVVDMRLAGTQTTGIGAGKANTAAMLGVCTAGAAVEAHAYTGGGKTDWYLPARDELRQLFLRKAKVGDFIFHGYWSSTEQDVNMAWIQDFYADYQPAPSDKSFANYVRPIRAF